MDKLTSLVKAQDSQLVATADLEGLSKVLFTSLDINEATRADYETRTPLFVEFVRTSGLTRNSYIEYKRYLHSRADFSIATKAKYLTVSKVILKELNRQGYLPADITSTIKGFKQSKKHKKDGLNDSEMSTLMEAVKHLPEKPKPNGKKQTSSFLT